MTQPNLSASRRELWLPAVLCSLLLVLEIFLLVTDVAPWRTAPSGPPVAQLSRSLNTVRLRGADTLIWSDPQYEEGKPLLYRQDAIATMAESWATIRFLGGTEVLVDPDSMVLIEDVPERPSRAIKLKLVHGKIRIKREARTSVFVNQTEVETPSMEREVVIEAPRLAPTPAAPVAAPVPTSAAAKPVLRAKPAPKQVTRKQVAPKAAPKPTPKLLPKPKIRAPKFRDSKREPSTFDRFFATFLANFLANFPVPSAQAEEVDGAQGYLELSWDSIEGAHSYDVEIAHDSAFRNRISKGRVDAPKAELTLSQLGGSERAYYRVAAVSASGERGEFSDPIEVRRGDFSPFPPEGPKKWSFDFGLGTTYQFREFRNPTIPTRVYARGFSPLGFLLRGRFALKTDWHLTATTQLWLESLYPISAHIQSGTYGVSHFDFLAQAQKRVGNVDWSAVLLAGHTFSVAWSGVTPVITRQPIFGLGVGLGPTLRAHRWISWNVILAGILLGTLGIEFQGSVRVPLSQKIRSAFESHHLFGEGYALLRYLPDEEAAFGIGIRMGYGF